MFETFAAIWKRLVSLYFTSGSILQCFGCYAICSEKEKCFACNAICLWKGKTSYFTIDTPYRFRGDLWRETVKQPVKVTGFLNAAKS